MTGEIKLKYKFYMAITFALQRSYNIIKILMVVEKINSQSICTVTVIT